MLEAAIITGLVSWFGGMLGSALNDEKESEKLQREMDYIDEMYNLNKEKVEQEFKEATRQANKNADEAEQQADLTDLGQDIAEVAAGNDVNAAIDSLYLSQANDTWNWNLQNMQIASQQGAGLAQIAASGIRAGSSLNDAVLMETATNSAQLQFSQDTKRRSDNNNLASVLNNIAGQKFNIMGNRIGADITRQNALDLRNSYAAGGYNYNLYENQKQQMETQYNYQRNNLKKEKEQHEGWNKWLNAFTGGLTAGSKGFATGYNIAETAYEGMKYRTKIGE